MPVVTTTVRERYRAQLLKLNTEPLVAVRLMLSPSNPRQLKMVLDEEREGDHVVKSEDGRKLLLVGTDLLPELEGKVIEFREIPQGAGFRSIF